MKRAAEMRASTSGRLPQLDNLKAALIAWIIGGHALLGYSALGGWEYDELREVTFNPRVEFVLTATLGPSALVVVGTLFLIAGLFAPGSLARRGSRRFVLDRAVRLGAPYLAFALVLWPVLLWLAHLATGRRVPPTHVLEGEPLLASGPLWFVAVLLIFSVVYATVAGRPARPVRVRPPRASYLLGLMAAITVTTFVIRIWLPANGAEPVGWHFWQWPQCAAMFVLGIRHGELARNVSDRLCRACGAITLVTLVVAVSAAVLGGVSNVGDQADRFLGGWRWEALGTAAFEGVLVVAGSLWLLGTAQRRFTGTGPVAAATGRGAYTAYLLQAPVLFGVAVAARALPAPAEIKAPLVATASIALCFWLGWLLVSRTPLGRVL